MTKQETECHEINLEEKDYSYRFFPRKKRLERDDIISVVNLDTLDKLLMDSGELKRVRGNRLITLKHRKLSISQIVYILHECYGIEIGIDTLQERRRFLKKNYGIP